MKTRFIEKILESFNEFYEKLYDGEIPEDSSLVEKCEKWMKLHPHSLGILTRERGDLFVSDRELNALALALALDLGA